MTEKHLDDPADSALVERIVNGDIVPAARLIRSLDDGRPSAGPIMKGLYRHTGRARVIGLTGPPGAGKSTLIDHVIKHYRAENRTVGVIVIDPSSPFTGGAILGDRVRLAKHNTDDGVFIHSLATRGNSGGISDAACDVIDVMDAMGKDVILIETVGVGQIETDIKELVNTTLVVLTPNMGDEIQSIKAGVLEVGDIFIINKSDTAGADETAANIQAMIAMTPRSGDQWKPVVVKTVGLTGEGVGLLAEAIDRQAAALGPDGRESGRARRARIKLTNEVKKRIETAVDRCIESKADWQGVIDQLGDKTIDPISAAEKICDDVFIKLGL